ncbi:hypothetical protein ABNG02_16490 [Halorubrum ejinorense]|uniref:Uncharacterized protein n=2 Tax=Halorubrum ejinorense TaxID=425309 RepID=A0ABV4ISP4_9EURY
MLKLTRPGRIGARVGRGGMRRARRGDHASDLELEAGTEFLGWDPR